MDPSILQRLARIEHNLADLDRRVRGLESEGGRGADEEPVAAPPPLEPSPWERVQALADKKREWMQAREPAPAAPAAQDLRSTDSGEAHLATMAPNPLAAVLGEKAPAASLPRKEGTARRGLDVREWLRRIHMLPPTEGGSMESQLGMWWFTRIGALLLTVGAIFTAAHFSRHTPPPVRFVFLLAASGGITGLGLFLERRVPKFGAVLFGAGLALQYFCAFAAYAVPAVKVINDPTVAMAWQMVAAASIVSCAVWRRSPTIGTMGIALGYLGALFAATQGLDNTALTAALILAVASVEFYVKRGWFWPILIAVVPTYLTYLIVILAYWLNRGAPPSLWVMELWILAPMVLFVIADWSALRLGRLMPSKRRTLFYGFNIFMGILLCVSLASRGTVIMYRPVVLFALGILATGGAAAYYRISPTDRVTQALIVKASTLIAFGFMDLFEAKTRWATLAAESLVLALTARRTRLIITELMMAASWLLSVGFMVHHLGNLNGFTNPPVGNDYWLSAILYLVLSGGVMGFQAHWLAARPGWREAMPAGMDERWTCDAVGTDVRRGVHFLYSILLTPVTLGLGYALAPPQWLPVVWLGGAALLVASAVVARHWIPALAALATLVLAHVRFVALSSNWPTGEVRFLVAWGNGAALTGVTLAGALAVWARFGRNAAHPLAEKTRRVETGLYALTWVALAAMVFKITGLNTFGLILILMALAVAVSSVSLRLRGWAESSQVLPTAAALGLLVAWWRAPEAVWAEPGAGWALLALMGAFGYAGLFSCWGALRDRWVAPDQRAAGEWGLITLATGIGIYGLSAFFPGPERILAGAVTAGILAVAGRWARAPKAIGAVMALLFATHGFFYVLTLLGGDATHPVLTRLGVDESLLTRGRVMTATLIAAAITLLLAGWTRWWAASVEGAIPNYLSQWLGALAMISSYVLFLNMEGEARGYATVFCGLTAIVALALGFVRRLPILRWEALVGLLFCVGRVFLIDIQTMTARMVAFIALGIVLLVVGYVYSRFADSLEGGAASQEPHEPERPSE